MAVFIARSGRNILPATSQPRSMNFGAGLRDGPPQRVGDTVEAMGLIGYVNGATIVGLPAGRAGPVEVAQVVEALVGAPPLHATGVVERRIPVHEFVRAEGPGRPVLKPRILPGRHDVDYAAV